MTNMTIPTPCKPGNTNIFTCNPDIPGTYVVTVTVTDTVNNTATATGTLVVNSQPPVTKYKCSGTPNYQCIEDPNGQYKTLAECQAVCKQPPPSTEKIVVTNPTTGLIYRIGEPRVVRWTHTQNTGSNVKIELLKTGNLVKTIASNTPNDDAFAWTVPNVNSGTDYQIKVTSTSNNQYFGISGKFTIN